MVKLLLAGTGLIGHRHMQHILEHPDLELVGVIDPVITDEQIAGVKTCLLYTSPSPRDATLSRMPSSA